MSKVSKRLKRANRAVKVWIREFLGKTSDFEDKEEMAFEKKHLKAYIKGYERFTFGTHTVKDAMGRDIEEPTWHTVKQKLEQL